MMPIDFDMSGFDRLMKNAQERVQARKKKAVAAGATVIRDAAEQRAPVGPTHNLKNNIIQTEPKTGAGDTEYSYIGPRDVGGMTYGQRLALGGSFGKDAPYYGRMVEFGTSKMPAQPFLEPAFQASKDDALKAMAGVMREAIEGSGEDV
jgi:HK97 gp10 family phage protein